MKGQIPKDLFRYCFDKDRAPIGIGLNRESAIHELMDRYGVNYRIASEAWNIACFVDAERQRLDSRNQYLADISAKAKSSKIFNKSLLLFGLSIFIFNSVKYYSG